MKKNRILTIGLALLLMVLGALAQAPKAFYKYCVVTSITLGPGKAFYTTRSDDGKKVHSELLDASIDPLITEYGLTDKIGLGLSRGGENFNVDVNKFYKQNIPEDTYGNMMWASTKYLTFDASYHYFTTKRLDLSFFCGLGYYKLSGTAGNTNPDMQYQDPLFTYNAKGGVIRSGARVRWYFSKRFGFMSMIYGYKGLVKEPYKRSPISDAKGSGGFSTTLTGAGYEMGICFRIGKQKNVKAEAPKAPKEKKKRRERNDDENNDKVPLFSLVWD